MARSIHEAIRERGQATIALSGGNTPGPHCQISRRRRHIRAVRSTGTRSTSTGSTALRAHRERPGNFGSAKKQLLDRIAIPPGHIHRMRGEGRSGEGSRRVRRRAPRHGEEQGRRPPPRSTSSCSASATTTDTRVPLPGRQLAPSRTVSSPRSRPTPPRSGEAQLTLTVPVLENARRPSSSASASRSVSRFERIWATSGDVNSNAGPGHPATSTARSWAIDRAAGGMT